MIYKSSDGFLGSLKTKTEAKIIKKEKKDTKVNRTISIKCCNIIFMQIEICQKLSGPVISQVIQSITIFKLLTFVRSLSNIHLTFLWCSIS